MVDAKTTLDNLDPYDTFRPHITAGIDDTRTWVDPKGYRLSDRLWRAGVQDRAQIETVLRDGIARGLSPLQTARNAEALLNPYYEPRRDPETYRVKSVQPKGVGTRTPRQGPGIGPARPRNSGMGSYAARRLSRTETTRAFGAATMAAGKASPLLERMKWALSGNHDEPDQCDMNARKSSKGQPSGIYLVDEVPRYPDHPHEMCTIQPYVTKDDIAQAIPRLREFIRTGELPDRDWVPPAGTVSLFPMPKVDTAGIDKFLDDAIAAERVNPYLRLEPRPTFITRMGKKVSFTDDRQTFYSRSDAEKWAASNGARIIQGSQPIVPDYVERAANELNKFPVRAREQAWLRGGDVQITQGRGITEFPDQEAKRGVVPRGWEGTGKSWDDVPGAGGDHTYVVANRLEEGHGSASLVLHEHAHTYEAKTWGTTGTSPGWRAVHESQKWPTAYEANYPEESFAESLAKYYHSPVTRATLEPTVQRYFERELWIVE